MKTVLVTGGTGFIGSHFVKRLLKDGYRVVTLDNNFRNTDKTLSSSTNLIMIEGSVTAKDSVDYCFRVVPEISAVYHLAFINGTKHFYERPEAVISVGVEGTMNVINSAIQHAVREFLYMSSSEVYNVPTIIPTPEEERCMIPDVYNPRFSYAGSKLIGEIITANYGRKRFDKAIIVRPHNVYGPGMGFEHIIPEIITKIIDRTSDNIQIQGDGEDTRSFCHIDDFIDGMMLVLEKGQHLNTYHIGHPDEIKIKDVLKLINHYLSYDKVNFIPGPATVGGTGRRCPDISKMKLLGFDPKININEGIHTMINSILFEKLV